MVYPGDGNQGVSAKVKNLFSGRKPLVSRGGCRADRACALEPLEERLLLSTYTVTNTNDVVGAGSGTLRQAVIEANAHHGSDTIVLGAGTYNLTIVDAGWPEQAAATGDLDLTDTSGTLTIRGTGTATTVLDGQEMNRLFDVLPGVHVVLQDLMLRNGRAFDAGGLGDGLVGGGALLSEGGFVTLNNVQVASSEASPSSGQNGLGGGVYAQGGSLTVNRASFLWNSVGGGGDNVYGGGLATVGITPLFSGTINIVGNTVAGGNGVDFGGAGFDAYGGGLSVQGGSVKLPATTTVTQNGVTSGDGFWGNDGALPVAGGNGGQAVGGGIYVSGTLTMAGGNVSYNSLYAGHGGAGGDSTSAASAAGGAGGRRLGGGIAVDGSATLTNVVISANSFDGGRAGDGGIGGPNGAGGTGGAGGAALGGGLYLGGGSLTMVGGSVVGNNLWGGSAGKGGNAGTGGGLGGTGGYGGYVGGGGLYLNSAATVLTNVTISGNLAQSGSGGNGGMGVDNPGGAGGAGGAGGNGGGMNGGGIFGLDGTLTMTGCTVDNNQGKGDWGGFGGAGGTGAGAVVGGAGGAGGAGSGVQGGGLGSTGTAVSVVGSFFNGNSLVSGTGGTGGAGHGGMTFGGAGGAGGASGLAWGGGVSMGLSLALSQCSFMQNSAQAGSGGAGGAGGVSAPGVGGVGGVGGDSSVAQGGAILAKDGTVTLADVVCSSNRAEGSAGGSGGQGGDSLLNGGVGGAGGTSSTSEGGDVALLGGQLIIDGGVFQGASADTTGGGNGGNGGNGAGGNGGAGGAAGGAYGGSVYAENAAVIMVDAAFMGGAVEPDMGSSGQGGNGGNAGNGGRGGDGGSSDGAQIYLDDCTGNMTAGYADGRAYRGVGGTGGTGLVAGAVGTDGTKGSVTLGGNSAAGLGAAYVTHLGTGNASLTYNDAGGKSASVRLAGPGSADVIRAVANATSSGNTLAVIAAGTTAASSFTATGNAATTTLGSLVAFGPLSSITAGTVAFSGTLLTGGQVRTVTLGDVVSANDSINTFVLGGSAAAPAGTLKMGNVSNLNVNTSAPLSLLQMKSWQNAVPLGLYSYFGRVDSFQVTGTTAVQAGAYFNATSAAKALGTVKLSGGLASGAEIGVGGNAGPVTVTGDMLGKLYATGDLGAVTISGLAGDATGANTGQILAQGTMASVTVGAARHLDVVAGIPNWTPGDDQTKAAPRVGSKVGSFKVTGKNVAGDLFADTNLIADIIGAVTSPSANAGNTGTKFGFWGRHMTSIVIPALQNGNGATEFHWFTGMVNISAADLYAIVLS